MSTMANPTAGTAAPASSTSPARPAHAGARKTGAESSPDLFANLLSLVGDTRSAPAPESSLLQADQEPASDAPAGLDPAAGNPLTDLLGWSARSGLAGAPGRATDGAAVQEADALRQPGPGTGLATAAAAQGGGSRGIDVDRLGMKPAEPGDNLEAFVLPDTTATAAETASAAATVSAPPSRHGGPAAQAAGSGLQRVQGASTVWRRASPAGTAAAPGLDSSAPESTRALQHAFSAQLRSTVALDERYGHSRAGETASSPASLAPGNAGPAAGLAGGLSGGLSGTHPSSTEATGPSGLIGSAESAAAPETGREGAASEATLAPDASAEPQAETVSHWSTQNLRHASLRVGQPGEDAIDIQLSLSGQEVRVDFRTDSAEARASLQHSANASLGDLLQGSGIQLGGVSVGSQGQPSQRDASVAAAEQASQRAARPPATPEAALAPLRPLSDGSRPLDVFA